MRTIRFFITFIITVCFLGTAYSQGITGKITDNVSNGELPGVKVTLKKNGVIIKNGTSNFAGEFNFNGFGAGKYIVELSHPDCNAFSQEINFAAGEAKKMDFVLTIIPAKASSYSSEEIEKAKQLEQNVRITLQQNTAAQQIYTHRTTETPFPLSSNDIKLLEPQKTGGKGFFETVNGRHSERSFVKKNISLEQVSTLLWVANGFNRPDKRTVPTGMNKQEMELYVIIDNMAYYYDAQNNSLKFITENFFKEALGQPDINRNAAITLIMVADTDKSSLESARMSTGYISQNIYLYAAAEDMGTVARGSFMKEDLARLLKLKTNQVIMLVQPVGFLK
jgi:SagB-type dehydrogenase family enzyme